MTSDMYIRGYLTVRLPETPGLGFGMLGNLSLNLLVMLASRRSLSLCIFQDLVFTIALFVRQPRESCVRILGRAALCLAKERCGKVETGVRWLLASLSQELSWLHSLCPSRQERAFVVGY